MARQMYSEKSKAAVEQDGQQLFGYCDCWEEKISKSTALAPFSSENCREHEGIVGRGKIVPSAKNKFYIESHCRPRAQSACPRDLPQSHHCQSRMRQDAARQEQSCFQRSCYCCRTWVLTFRQLPRGRDCYRCYRLQFSSQELRALGL